ncbi:hypothetical protein BOX30_07075 [Leptospirillum ferriphilum]|jgi:hypothetical protein|uniref:Uncharacterized protein n=3 Tax=Leptospirillum ferriphilum TaxID=178606 RepID=A0A059XWS6_9BACT|nr:hypothetical protein [Leptospirillum sp. Group II 'CF-1']AFS53136.1 hypothetical protein LFML04_0904 [Leptospirillum ferriphilum ML-04]AIA31580.1 hypothetical protein Y981_03950 [Leptospirillum ferriphilum YSK]OOH73225.1 hypothetical protein BOX24_03935 [Leptospirillum ferriphilum]AKS23865.1 hypothetical protein ABH19_09145 [Leptospirillum sp. Group II 'CF-1']OOH79122.1 hypothetical protein BOX30_07075 [Leptospirillum ferriphilum]
MSEVLSTNSKRWIRGQEKKPVIRFSVSFASSFFQFQTLPVSSDGNIAPRTFQTFVLARKTFSPLRGRWNTGQSPLDRIRREDAGWIPFLFRRKQVSHAD